MGQHKKIAMTATITGHDQQVGFRALIMKQAIQYNLAGHATNKENMVVDFLLMGDADRIADAWKVITKGPERAKGDVKLHPKDGKEADFDDKLRTFTIPDWTSSSRNITNKYDMVFHLRDGDSEVDAAAGKRKWYDIMLDTVQGDDKNKVYKDK